MYDKVSVGDEVDVKVEKSSTVKGKILEKIDGGRIVCSAAMVIEVWDKRKLLGEKQTNILGEFKFLDGSWHLMGIKRMS